MATLSEILTDQGWTLLDPGEARIRAQKTDQDATWTLTLHAEDDGSYRIVNEVTHPEHARPLVVPIACADQQRALDAIARVLSIQDEVTPGPHRSLLSFGLDDHDYTVTDGWQSDPVTTLTEHGWHVETFPAEDDEPARTVATSTRNGIEWNLTLPAAEDDTLDLHLTRPDVPGSVPMYLTVTPEELPRAVARIAQLQPEITVENYDDVFTATLLQSYPALYNDGWLKASVSLADMTDAQRAQRQAFVDACRATGWGVDESYEEMVHSEHMTVSPQARIERIVPTGYGSLSYYVAPDMVEFQVVGDEGVQRVQAFAPQFPGAVEGFAYLADVRGLLDEGARDLHLGPALGQVTAASGRVRVETSEGWATLRPDTPLPPMWQKTAEDDEWGAGWASDDEDEPTGSKRLDAAAAQLREAGWQVQTSEGSVHATAEHPGVPWTVTVTGEKGDWYVMSLLSHPDRPDLGLSFDLTTERGSEIPALVEQVLQWQRRGITPQNYAQLLEPEVLAAGTLFHDDWLPGPGIALAQMTPAQRSRYDQLYAWGRDQGWQADDDHVALVERDGAEMRPEAKVVHESDSARSYLEYSAGIDMLELQVYGWDDRTFFCQLFGADLPRALPLLADLARKPWGGKAQARLPELRGCCARVRCRLDDDPWGEPPRTVDEG